MRPHAWFSLASGFSLVLLVTTTGLWVQSHWRVYALFYHGSECTLAAVIRPGTAEMAVYHDAFPWPDRLKLFNEPDDVVPNGHGDEFVNYILFRQAETRIPLWVLASVATALPLAWLVGRLRPLHKPADRNRCPTCSYDLTANISGICPECGAPVVST
jgi:hypothetical protein